MAQKGRKPGFGKVNESWVLLQFENNRTLKSVADEVGVSRQRIAQITKKLGLCLEEKKLERKFKRDSQEWIAGNKTIHRQTENKWRKKLNLEPLSMPDRKNTEYVKSIRKTAHLDLIELAQNINSIGVRNTQLKYKHTANMSTWWRKRFIAAGFQWTRGYRKITITAPDGTVPMLAHSD